MNIKGQYNISAECSDYLTCYKGDPFIKWIPSKVAEKDSVIKIKLRHKKATSDFDSFFNYALSTKGLRQKSIFLKNDELPGSKPFFIIPPNGYKTLYSLMVHDSKELESKLFQPLLALNCVNTIKSLFKEVLELHYQSDDPSKAIQENREVILYNVPYVYAIKKGQADFDVVKQALLEI